MPREEWIEEANEGKRGKYQEQVKEYTGKGCRMFYEPIAVGCRGSVGRSLCKVLGCLGVMGQSRRGPLSLLESCEESYEVDIKVRMHWDARRDLITLRAQRTSLMMRPSASAKF